MKCPVCDHTVVQYTTAVRYYSAASNTCNLMCCKNCKCFFKDNVDNTLDFDFKIRGTKTYNTPDNFTTGVLKRGGFLKYIHDFVKKKIKRNPPIRSWLDFGSGMGFFLSILKEHYNEVAGIEIAEEGRQVSHKNGIVAYQNIADLPINKKFDIISSIDSFYYTLQPKELIDSFKSILNDNGYVVIRISLRNWLIKLNKTFNRRPDDNLRDHFINYSFQSISKLFTENGFELIAYTFKETGKLYYKPSFVIFNFIIRTIYYLSFGALNLHTGVTIIFRKK